MQNHKIKAMNDCLKNLEKIEFVITNACTGRCRHCSEGDHRSSGERIDPSAAADAVKKIATHYAIKTVMTFGGEPLLYPDAVYAVHSAAREMGVPKRQIITNGYFSKDISRICETAKMISECGANDILLSVDSFHQETIPLDIVEIFAAELLKRKVPLRLQPAWLVSREDDNHFNNETRKILESFSGTGIPTGDGNIIFPEGNALKYLGEYFTGQSPENPYTEDPNDVKCVSFSPDGTVLGGNIYTKDILDILRDYKPLNF